MSDPGCPRCGGPMHPEAGRNALSRRADVYICSACGIDEAMRDFTRHEPLPFERWARDPRACPL